MKSEGCTPDNDPVAIIGIGCRYPGANGVEEFWRVLCDGRETTGDYPGGRHPDIDCVYAAKTGIASTRGGFLEGIDRFDSDFFNVSPREAPFLDPQQRLLLEVAWEAIEDAGIPAKRLAGSRTGVFAGIWSSDYEACLQRQAEGLDFYATTGCGRYSASGRLAYFFDLRGPNLTIDTACSSSLVAIHLACQSLRNGECEMALAGGANVILRPELTIAYSGAHMLSPDGRSKFGDATANGYVRSEGAGMILLKPLARALAGGDPIYAVIRGSAVNNDGRSSGSLIAPSREAQESVVRAALRRANVHPGEIDYIEAHGTGTPTGDPVEIETLGRIVDTPERRRPCLTGSVKTNIGHTEAAAGVAGVIKTALALERGTIPASLHWRNPNPSIEWDKYPLRVQTATAPWPHANYVRFAGVNGFGITGTNAHVVLEGLSRTRAQVAASHPHHVFVLSAHSDTALQAAAQSWLSRLRSDAAWPPSLQDLAYTAGVRRSQHHFRLSLVAASRAELEHKLEVWVSGEQVDRVRSGKASPLERTVFVFPGHGAQWTGMAGALFSEPAFYHVLSECDTLIRKFAGWSVIDALRAPQMPEEASIAQPCLFAVMVALAALWRSWGIEPQAVIGHSMGECAAAVVCGALSLEDGARVICARSHLMKRVSGKGAMAFVALSMGEAAELAAEYAGRISLAVHNGPTSTVLSGDVDAITEIVERLSQREVFCRRVRVDVASHSAQMDPLLQELERSLVEIKPRKGDIPLYSTTSGRREDGPALGPAYWCRNLRQPVLFSPAVTSLLQDGFDTFIEVGPHPLLTQTIEEHIVRHEKEAFAASSLRRDSDDLAEMLDALGALYVAGSRVDFGKLYPNGACLRLPAYPWQRKRHWIEADRTPEPQRALVPVQVPETTSDLYELHWCEANAVQATAGPGCWIILSGETQIASSLESELHALGHDCLRIAGVEELARALEDAGSRCRGIVRIPAVSGIHPQDACSEALDIVRTVQAAAAGPQTPRLWLITTQVWRLPGDTDVVCVAQSPVWGIGRVIEREHPELRCVNVDLRIAPERNEIRSLALLLCQDGPEEQLAVRGSKYFVARYRRIQHKWSTPVFRAEATYLLTGGLGGIGLILARWMVEHGARHLALASRRPPNEAAQAEISQLEAAGATIRVFSADTGCDDQAAQLLATIRAEMPELKGIFHLAAANDAVLLGNINAGSIERVLHPKAGTAWALDRHLGDVPLDFFVLFSSIAAAISQPGSGSYAAANSYVEAMSRYRRARGMKAQSIQWGSWLSTGLLSAEKRQTAVVTYQQMGIDALGVERALKDFAAILAIDGDVMALPVNWEQFARSFENSAPPRVFTDLLPRSAESGTAPAVTSLREALAATEPSRRRAALESHLQKTLAVVLKSEAARIDPAKPFGLMGMDSLMALEFGRRISSSTSLRLPVTAVFNYPTVQKLAAELARRMDVHEPERIHSANGTAGAISGVAALSEEEAIAALLGNGGSA